MKDLIDALKSKEKEKISTQVSTEVQKGREWLQDHGEWALLVGILAGVVIVLFFKILILLIVLGGLASYVIWQLSLDDGPSKSAFPDQVESLAPVKAKELQSEQKEPEKVPQPVVEMPESAAASEPTNGHPEKKSAARDTSSEQE